MQNATDKPHSHNNSKQRRKVHFVVFWGNEFFIVCEEGLFCSQSKYAALVLECVCVCVGGGGGRGGGIWEICRQHSSFLKWLLLTLLLGREPGNNKSCSHVFPCAQYQTKTLRL